MAWLSLSRHETYTDMWYGICHAANGHHPAGHTRILGLEAAGTVMEFGSGVGSKFKAGDRVMALCNGGAYAEQVLTVHP